MRIPRIYHPEPLQAHTDVVLSAEAFHHLSRVLRMKEGQQLVLFDGSNQIFNASIILLDKKTAIAGLADAVVQDRESPLDLHLGQVISRGERMEFTIQKSVELGVATITPLFSEYCGVKFDDARLVKKIQQWQSIAIAACEQCGRNRVPVIRPAIPLASWCCWQDNSLKVNLHPGAGQHINKLPPLSNNKIRLLIGPEGGLSVDEIAMTRCHGFVEVLLGPRILRTETAALAAITALQVRFGDLG